jgi:hypothetical protein
VLDPADGPYDSLAMCHSLTRGDIPESQPLELLGRSTCCREVDSPRAPSIERSILEFPPSWSRPPLAFRRGPRMDEEQPSPEGSACASLWSLTELFFRTAVRIRALSSALMRAETCRVKSFQQARLRWHERLRGIGAARFRAGGLSHGIPSEQRGVRGTPIWETAATPPSNRGAGPPEKAATSRSKLSISASTIAASGRCTASFHRGCPEAPPRESPKRAEIGALTRCVEQETSGTKNANPWRACASVRACSYRRRLRSTESLRWSAQCHDLPRSHAAGVRASTFRSGTSSRDSLSIFSAVAEQCVADGVVRCHALQAPRQDLVHGCGVRRLSLLQHRGTQLG